MTYDVTTTTTVFTSVGHERQTLVGEEAAYAAARAKVPAEMVRERSVGLFTRPWNRHWTPDGKAGAA